MCEEVVEESHVSERLQIPERSLLQSGRKVTSLPAWLDIHSLVFGGVCVVLGGMPGKKVEHKQDQYTNKSLKIKS